MRRGSPPQMPCNEADVVARSEARNNRGINNPDLPIKQLGDNANSQFLR